MRATIHQPDFMPWFGFFNKIAKADTWIILDHVSNNPRDAAFWGRRVQVLVNGKPNWLSIPLNRPPQTGTGKVGQPIKDMTINMSDLGLMAKRWKTVYTAYAKAPYFRQYADIVEEYFTSKDPILINRNLGFIATVCDVLNIKTQTVLSSSFENSSKSTQLLIDLLGNVGADSYICGGGADGYQQDHLFEKKGISLHYNTFEHPIYQQQKASIFVPGLSIIDALFNVGPEELKGLLRNG
jgi:hypothetical protein